MNMLMLVVVALVALCYFGGNKCPKVLKDNKEMLLGVVIGLALCSFMGLRMEGMINPANSFSWDAAQRSSFYTFNVSECLAKISTHESQETADIIARNCLNQAAHPNSADKEHF